MNTLEFPFTGNLTPHPLNQRIYGQEKLNSELVSSITNLGILEPLLLNKQRQILSGHRRWAVAAHLKIEQVPVIYFTGSALEAEQVIIESNRQRVKTKGQVAREAAELMRIEKTLAATRRESALKKGKKTPVPPLVRPSEGQTEGRASEIVAQKLGQSKNTVEKEVALVSAAEAGDPKAQEELAKLDRNETSVAKAYGEIYGNKNLDPQSTLHTFWGCIEKIRKNADSLLDRKSFLSAVPKTEKDKLFRAVSDIVHTLNKFKGATDASQQ
jgi:ParB family chromosome partitioning protein